MFFDKLFKEKELSEFLGKIERCRENCQTEEGADCLNDLEHTIADRLDSVQEFFDYPVYYSFSIRRQNEIT